MQTYLPENFIGHPVSYSWKAVLPKEKSLERCLATALANCGKP